jgi:hypothetical protein
MFCDVDDYCQEFQPYWEQQQLTMGIKQRRRSRQLYLSEIMTIIIHFHQSSYRDFKAYYQEHVMVHLRSEFPKLVSYPRFVTLMKETILPLCGYLYSLFGTCSGVSFVDSTPLAVCHNRRIQQNKVFEGIATRGKTSMGWFYGLKLHLVVNDQGELLACQLTPGNVDDRTPVPILSKRLFGKLFGDRGYVSRSLFEQLWQNFQALIAVRVTM